MWSVHAPWANPKTRLNKNLGKPPKETGLLLPSSSQITVLTVSSSSGETDPELLNMEWSSRVGVAWLRPSSSSCNRKANKTGTNKHAHVLEPEPATEHNSWGGFIQLQPSSFVVLRSEVAFQWVFPTKFRIHFLFPSAHRSILDFTDVTMRYDQRSLNHVFPNSVIF